MYLYYVICDSLCLWGFKIAPFWAKMSMHETKSAATSAALTLTSILPSTTPTYQFLPLPQLGFFLISSLKQLKKLLYTSKYDENVLGTAVKCVLPKTNNFGAYHLETSKNHFKLANTTTNQGST